jgi:hypothetical protein
MYAGLGDGGLETSLLTSCLSMPSALTFLSELNSVISSSEMAMGYNCPRKNVTMGDIGGTFYNLIIPSILKDLNNENDPKFIIELFYVFDISDDVSYKCNLQFNITEFVEMIE